MIIIKQRKDISGRYSKNLKDKGGDKGHVF